MIRFILGEDRHVKYFVHSVKSEYFVVKDATYELIYNGEVEASGSCELTQEEDGSFVDVKLQPMYRSNLYILEITLMIADEVIKNREQMEVV
ncbi:hypothetical protein [Hungatella sp.]|uniref:hypothetical protein n=1 Tax=Hungatella sp. TaxID=2613924 RepID=UPI002A83B800|nr:hypothetical protein [Hungatella sp.]